MARVRRGSFAEDGGGPLGGKESIGGKARPVPGGVAQPHFQVVHAVGREPYAQLRADGVEAFVEAQPIPHLALRGDVTAVDARFVVTNNPVPGAPRLLGSVEARFDAKPWSAGLAGRFLGPRPLNLGAQASSSTMIDAVGGWTRGRIGLQLQVDNLLGTDWNEGEYNFASRWDMSAPKSELPSRRTSPPMT